MHLGVIKSDLRGEHGGAGKRGINHCRSEVSEEMKSDIPPFPQHRQRGRTLLWEFRVVAGWGEPADGLFSP